jgi:hypothetical protein
MLARIHESHEIVAEHPAPHGAYMKVTLKRVASRAYTKVTFYVAVQLFRDFLHAPPAKVTEKVTEFSVTFADPLVQKVTI